MAKTLADQGNFSQDEIMRREKHAIDILLANNITPTFSTRRAFLLGMDNPLSVKEPEIINRRCKYCGRLDEHHTKKCPRYLKNEPMK